MNQHAGEKWRRVIGQLVRQEIDGIAHEMKEVVREAVRARLLPQLREAIRDSLSEAVEELLPGEASPAGEANISEVVLKVPAGEETPGVERELVLKNTEEPTATPELGLAAGEIQPAGDQDGRYVYCITNSGAAASLGNIGLEGSEVYTIPYNDICAVVHNCPAQPYQSDEQAVVTAWVMTHQQVVEAAWERWGMVLPLSFDTIIKGETKGGAERNVQDWLTQEYERLRSEMERVRGKAEYGVQVFWDAKIMAQTLTETSPEIRKLDEEIRNKPSGLAYMYRQKLENLIKREMETKADECFKDFYSRIRKHADDIRVERTKTAEQGLQMIMNLSCLVYKDRYTALGEELDEINQMEGFSVRFTGPWPPYSFVGGA